jgi:retron-type reverse transcriptase
MIAFDEAGTRGLWRIPALSRYRLPVSRLNSFAACSGAPLEHRIADKRILRLIAKWLNVGITEDGLVTRSERGTPQGAVISPILANVYLHYVFDLWTHRWRRNATGATFDFLGFQHFCTRSRKWDSFVIGRRTIKKTMLRQLQAVKMELRKRMHDPIAKTRYDQAS